MKFHLPDLLGKPENDPLVQQFIAHYGLVDGNESEESEQRWREENPGEPADAYQKACASWREAFAFYVLDPVNYVIELNLQVEVYGTPLVVKEVTLRAGFPGVLPYGLRQEADLGEFSIGRLVSKQRVNDSILKCFLHEGLTVWLWYAAANGHFEMLSLRPVDPGLLVQLDFHEGLKAQKGNLVTSIDGEIARWRQESPVHLWRQRMAEGDDIFTEENLALSQAEIDAFIDAIRQAVAKKSPTQIVNALKKTVKRFNRLTRKHGHFIETSEREELAPYLENIVAATGLTWEAGFDITFEWRAW